MSGCATSTIRSGFLLKKLKNIKPQQHTTQAYTESINPTSHHCTLWLFCKLGFDIVPAIKLVSLMWLLWVLKFFEDFHYTMSVKPVSNAVNYSISALLSVSQL